MRKSIWFVPVFAAAVSMSACSQLSRNGDEKEGKEEENSVEITLDQVPAAARATLEKEAAGAKIDKVDKEMEKGKTIYEVDVPISGKNHEIKVAEDGKLISKKLDEEGEEKEDDEKGEKHEKHEKGGKEDKD